jgi:hypothetical protein
MLDTITCPSGLTGRIRGMKVSEERVLADKRLARDGGQIDALLAACWTETLEPGPYTCDASAPMPWGKVLQGDRFFALLQIRALTYGPEYAFSVPCQNRACGARIDWEFDLRELPVRALSDESRAAFVNGNRFETVLPGAGTRVGFRLLVGDDERRIQALRRGAADRPLSALLAFRLTDVAGIEPREHRRFVEDLSMRDADFLSREFDRVDCGVETTIEVECPECGSRQEVELPFDASFFLPGRKRPSRGPDSSSRP